LGPKAAVLDLAGKFIFPANKNFYSIIAMWSLSDVVCSPLNYLMQRKKANKKGSQPEVTGELLRKFDQSQGVPHRVCVFVLPEQALAH
jgi:hypothetical protein